MSHLESSWRVLNLRFSSPPGSRVATPVTKEDWRHEFRVGERAGGEKVNAAGKNGVLTVTIPKQAKAMPRRIQIDG
jgi:HSP20 family molecular chaperone IbpA